VLCHNLHTSVASCAVLNTRIPLPTYHINSDSKQQNTGMIYISNGQLNCHYQHIVNTQNLAICSLAFGKIMLLIANKLQACLSIRIIFFKSTFNFTINSQTVNKTYIMSKHHWKAFLFQQQALLSEKLFNSDSRNHSLNHISYHFLIPLSDSSLICTVSV